MLQQETTPLMELRPRLSGVDSGRSRGSYRVPLRSSPSLEDIWRVEGRTVDWFNGIIGALALVAAVVVPLFVYRRSAPRRQLIYRVSSTPLLRHKAAASRVTVALDGQELADPHIVELVVQSNSRADIGSDRFNAGSPLMFDLGTRICQTLTENSTDIAIDVRNGGVSLPPQLIKPKDTVRVAVLVDGKPMLSQPSKTLTDVRVDAESQLTKMRSYRASVRNMVLFAISFAVINAVMWLPSDTSVTTDSQLSDQVMLWIKTFITLASIGMFTLISFATLRDVKRS